MCFQPAPRLLVLNANTCFGIPDRRSKLFRLLVYPQIFLAKQDAHLLPKHCARSLCHKSKEYFRSRQSKSAKIHFPCDAHPAPTAFLQIGPSLLPAESSIFPVRARPLPKKKWLHYYIRIRPVHWSGSRSHMCSRSLLLP